MRKPHNAATPSGLACAIKPANFQKPEQPNGAGSASGKDRSTSALGSLRSGGTTRSSPLSRSPRPGRNSGTRPRGPRRRLRRSRSLSPRRRRKTRLPLRRRLIRQRHRTRRTRRLLRLRAHQLLLKLAARLAELTQTAPERPRNIRQPLRPENQQAKQQENKPLRRRPDIGEHHHTRIVHRARPHGKDKGRHIPIPAPSASPSHRSRHNPMHTPPNTHGTPPPKPEAAAPASRPASPFRLAHKPPPDTSPKPPDIAATATR